VSEQFSDVVQAAISSGLGSLIGTAVKMVRHPPTRWGAWFIQAFTSISVGAFSGGVAYNYFHFDAWTTSSIAAAAAYISEEILRGLENYGRRKIRTSEVFNTPGPNDQGDGA
jgi:hypothetical protein